MCPDNVRRTIRMGLLIPVVSVGLYAQQWDLGSRLAEVMAAETGSRVTISVEQRARYEDRTGTTFGKDPDIETGLVRTRFGMTFLPVKWLKFSGMVQDSRAPWYGAGAPNTVRDEADLHEAYVELFPGAKGFGMTAGRMMLNYGEARLIGSPQRGNLSRTYDHARAYYRFRGARFEMLYVSPVKVRIGEFNQPVLGDHVFGTYNSFPNFYKKNLLEVYPLRHDQNRPGGFTSGNRVAGTDRLRVNTFGGRLAGPAPLSSKYSLEGAVQTGMVGPARQRAAAWFSSLTRRWTVAGKPLDISAEYKFASGSDDPADTSKSGTFDQLYAANHDKFGHEDLFGWRNLHNARTLAVLGITKSFALNFMYDSYWVASLRDGIYNGSGKLIARSAKGTAGRHVGQEADIFGTYKYKHFLVGAGYGRFFSGEFIRNATSGVGPTYLYLFHTYSF
jgi:hypothetical protein